MRSTSVGEIASWLKGLERLRAAGSVRSPTFIKPYHLVTLAMALRENPRGMAELPDEVSRYATRMHLWDAAGLEPPDYVREHPTEDRFQPTAPLRTEEDVATCSRNLTAIVQRHGKVDEETLSSIDIAIAELANNCFNHAGLGAGEVGLVCAQAWEGGNRAQIAFADPGMGIRESLSRNPGLRAHLSEANACKLASEYGVTGNPGGHTGYGLCLARDLMRNNGGVFVVFSGREAFWQGGSRRESRHFDPLWPGTMVVIEWRTNYPLSASDVYANWPLPPGMDHDDFF